MSWIAWSTVGSLLTALAVAPGDETYACGCVAAVIAWNELTRHETFSGWGTLAGMLCMLWVAEGNGPGAIHIACTLAGATGTTTTVARGLARPGPTRTGPATPRSGRRRGQDRRGDGKCRR